MQAAPLRYHAPSGSGLRTRWRCSRSPAWPAPSASCRSAEPRPHGASTPRVSSTPSAPRTSTPTCSRRSAASTSTSRPSSTTRTPTPTPSRRAPSVAQEVSAAQLIVQNGVGLRHFMNKIESASPNPSRKVIVVQNLLGLPDRHPQPAPLVRRRRPCPRRPRRWPRELSALQPSHASYFAGQPGHGSTRRSIPGSPPSAPSRPSTPARRSPSPSRSPTTSCRRWGWTS